MPTPVVLSVAEKPSVAKEIAQVLGEGRQTRSSGPERRCPIWSFECTMAGYGTVSMRVTSVMGHLQGADFAPQYRSWETTNPLDLFDAPIQWFVEHDKLALEQQLQAEAKQADVLALWLDCDREGEGIAFEVIDTCNANRPRNRAPLRMLRARFSSVAPADVRRAFANMVPPDKRMSEAVRARTELDLRLGSAFTRLQTKALSTRFDELIGKLISYGPCQFPTVGFVVERYLAIQEFVPERFWGIDLRYTPPSAPSGGAGAAAGAAQQGSNGDDEDDEEEGDESGGAAAADDDHDEDGAPLSAAARQRRSHARAVRGRTRFSSRGNGSGNNSGNGSSSSSSSGEVRFTWARGRLYDFLTSFVLYELAVEAGFARVVRVDGRPTSRWKPTPLNSVEFAKAASRYLRMGSQEAAKVAEDLYSMGVISYPRTETQVFDETIDLKALVGVHTQHPYWGAYANTLLNGGKFGPPRAGGKHDQAHPPIHPLRSATRADLDNDNDKWRVYEFITRHFLACVSMDAAGALTTISVEMGGEMFSASGTQVLERNFLDVYPWTKWNTNLLPNFQEGSTFVPSSCLLHEGTTAPPLMLTESELIELMDTHGIGTDATIPDLIAKVVSRAYLVLDQGSRRFMPTTLGIGLVRGYDALQLEPLFRPFMRAHVEADLVAICNGTKQRPAVMRECLDDMRPVYIRAAQNTATLAASLAHYFQPVGANGVVVMPPPQPQPLGGGHGGGGAAAAAGGAPRSAAAAAAAAAAFSRCGGGCGGHLVLRRSLVASASNSSSSSGGGRDRNREYGEAAAPSSNSAPMRYTMRCGSGCAFDPLVLSDKVGEVRPGSHTCPLCGFQTLKTKRFDWDANGGGGGGGGRGGKGGGAKSSGSSSTHEIPEWDDVCPWCSNHHPPAHAPLYLTSTTGSSGTSSSRVGVSDVPMTGASMPCYKCCNLECSVARGKRIGRGATPAQRARFSPFVCAAIPPQPPAHASLASTGGKLVPVPAAATAAPAPCPGFMQLKRNGKSGGFMLACDAGDVEGATSAAGGAHSTSCRHVVFFPPSVKAVRVSVGGPSALCSRCSVPDVGLFVRKLDFSFGPTGGVPMALRNNNTLGGVGGGAAAATAAAPAPRTASASICSGTSSSGGDDAPPALRYNNRSCIVCELNGDFSSLGFDEKPRVVDSAARRAAAQGPLKRGLLAADAALAAAESTSSSGGRNNNQPLSSQLQLASSRPAASGSSSSGGGGLAVRPSNKPQSASITIELDDEDDGEVSTSTSAPTRGKPSFSSALPRGNTTAPTSTSAAASVLPRSTTSAAATASSSMALGADDDDDDLDMLAAIEFERSLESDEIEMIEAANAAEAAASSSSFSHTAAATATAPVLDIEDTWGSSTSALSSSSRPSNFNLNPRATSTSSLATSFASAANSATAAPLGGKYFEKPGGLQLKAAASSASIGGGKPANFNLSTGGGRGKAVLPGQMLLSSSSSALSLAAGTAAGPTSTWGNISSAAQPQSTSTWGGGGGGYASSNNFSNGNSGAGGGFNYYNNNDCGGGAATAAVLCKQHNLPCVTSTSNSAANPGRQFWTCALGKGPQQQGQGVPNAAAMGNCGFAAWCDAAPQTSASAGSGSSGRFGNNSSSSSSSYSGGGGSGVGYTGRGPSGYTNNSSSSSNGPSGSRRGDGVGSDDPAVAAGPAPSCAQHSCVAVQRRSGPSSKRPGALFWVCPSKGPSGTPDDCRLFQWIDDANFNLGQGGGGRANFNMGQGGGGGFAGGNLGGSSSNGFAAGGGGGGGVCFKCQQPGHYSNNCPNAGDASNGSFPRAPDSFGAASRGGGASAGRGGNASGRGGNNASSRGGNNASSRGGSIRGGKATGGSKRKAVSAPHGSSTSAALFGSSSSGGGGGAFDEDYGDHDHGHAAAAPKEKKPRLCSLCKGGGHTKAKCPSNLDRKM